MGKIHASVTTANIIVQVILIFSVIYLAQNIVVLKGEINAINVSLSSQISENKQISQDQVNQLTESLMSTKSSLSSQLNEIKASASSDFSGIIQDKLPSVVSIGTDVAQGSGFIISNDGYVITNAHVLSGGHYARVLTYQSNTWLPATLIGYNSEMDVAVLKISGQYNALQFGNSDALQVGEKVIAMGNPLGLSFSVTEGIVSALKREGQNNLPNYIQVDVPLNPGNSGGPLINKKGEVIGINNFKIQNSENLGFALESNSAVASIRNIFKSTNSTSPV